MASATYSYVRENLARVWDEVEEGQEPVILTRRGHEDLALVPARELQSLRETAHLLRSPENARRLLQALARSRHQGGTEFASIEAVAEAVGLTATGEQ